MRPEYSWDLDKTDPMIVNIFYDGKKVMSFFLGEAIESAGYHAIMKHIEEINRSPWLHKWHGERKEEVIKILKE